MPESKWSLISNSYNNILQVSLPIEATYTSSIWRSEFFALFSDRHFLKEKGHSKRHIIFVFTNKKFILS